MQSSLKPQARPAAPATTVQRGRQAEAQALEHLRRAGLTLVARNYRPPGRGVADLDLVMREPDGTLVFVEVRQRASQRQGGALASVTRAKCARLVLAARHFLQRFRHPPPCRFDVVALEGEHDVLWVKGAFGAD